jgi:chromate transport protein ChrA
VGTQPVSAEVGSATSVPTEGEALRFWLKLGMISFGGPAGQVAIMHEELVEKRGWISERRFLHALNFCMALPGPEAQQLASYVGYSMYGVRGAFTAGGLFVLPSFVLLCAMSAVYVEFGEVAAVEGVVRGLGAAVIALIAAAVLRVGRRVIRTPPALAMAVLAFALLVTFAPSFVFIISGAPLIDRIRTTGAFASSLNGITIAVVGVIAALGVFVARHAAVVDGQPDWLVIALAAVAFVASVRFKVGVISIVASCAGVGLIASTVG